MNGHQGEAERVTAGTLAETAQSLSMAFAAEAAEHDAADSFVEGNYARLRAGGFMAVGVPLALGGGGASIRDLAGMLRLIGQGCGSTALALAMHSHQVATAAWRWQHDAAARPVVEPVLRRVAAEDAVLVTSGGSDWIGSSGRAEAVEGGYRVTARKAFASASPGGTLFNTSALCGDRIIHFSLPFDTPGLRRLDSWRALGMRGTGSGDVVLEDVFVPADRVTLSRPAGQWHPVWHIMTTTSTALIFAVYLGIAEAARDQAVASMTTRSGDRRNVRLIGELDSALWLARAAHEAILAVTDRNAPCEAAVNEVMFGRLAVQGAALSVVELAMEAMGGAGFYRAAGLERRFRDIQAARYHPMRREMQQAYAGALALGEPVATIF